MSNNTREIVKDAPIWQRNLAYDWAAKGEFDLSLTSRILGAVVQATAQIEREKAELVAALGTIQHKAESQRVWNGMGYTATNPVCADIIKICEQQISKAKAGSSCHPSDFKHCHKPDLIDDVCECVDECKYKAKAGAA